MSGQNYFSAIANNSSAITDMARTGLVITGSTHINAACNSCASTACSTCIYKTKTLKHSMNTIILKPEYGMGILLPIEQFAVLDKMKVVSGTDYSDTGFKFSGKKLTFSLVNYSDILPEPPDPKIALAKRDARRKQLMAELEEIEKEEKV